MESEGSALVPALGEKTGNVSVSGWNDIAEAVPAAFVLFHTPPPDVPT